MSESIKQVYEHLIKARNGLLAFHQREHFDMPMDVTSSILVDCDGYMTGSGIAVLKIGEILPHSKTELTAAVNAHWLGCIHAAIGKLAEKSPVPQFDKAMVCLLLDMPHGLNNARIWDTSNRAINLILNNLKGVFFPDDNIEHMAFTVVGRWSETPKTTIYIGDFGTQSVEIMQRLTT